MRDQAAINEKIRQKLLLRYQEHGSPLKGKPGKKHTEESKALISSRVRETEACKPKRTKKQLLANRCANVQAYNARKLKAILPTSDLVLIEKIYEHRPEGYHVDHIQALARGGPHHQDNLQYLPGTENSRKNADNDYDRSLIIRWQDTIPL